MCVHYTKKRYAQEILKWFKMDQCRPVNTPMNCSKILQLEDDSGPTDSKIYRRLVGRLLYLTHTRPNITFVVNMLSRFVSKPTRKHLGAAKHLLRYLAGTTTYGLIYTRTEECRLRGFIDSDWGGSIEDRRSTSGKCL